MSSIQNMSLYIPRVFENISEDKILRVFEELCIGKVSHVDLVPQLGKNYNSVYIHFDYWYDNKHAHNLQDRILDPTKDARIVYDDPWFWVILENKSVKKVKQQRKPCINLVDFAEQVEQEYTEQDFQNMSELEDIMDEEDLYQRHYDSRYVRTIEEENASMHRTNSVLNYEVMCLRNKLHSSQEFYIEGIMKHLPVGDAMELRRKMGI